MQLNTNLHNIYIYNDIASSIIKYGGTIVPIYINDYDSALNLIDKCDGVAKVE